jgi:hypothetical protein
MGNKNSGRKSTYTRAIADEICHRMSLGETLSQVCRSENMPPKGTVLEWVKDDRHGFSDRYARAREAMLEHWADEIIDIADDSTRDWIARKAKSGETLIVLDREHIERSKLRIDVRKWLLARLKPRTYGDRVTHSGEAESPVQLEMRGSVDELRERILAITARVRAEQTEIPKLNA